MDRSAGEISTVTVETASGRLTGRSKDGVVRFKGIPFAKPPVGALRWRMPEPAEPWTGVRDATRFGSICPQAPSQIETLMGGSIGEQSEDCLTLNIWTPPCDGARRPVMVWLHGGAFVIGAGSQGIYDGKYLAARDVVVVTVNYRLGAFGFVDLHGATDGRLPATGSEGLADQIRALQWVKANIAQFGGDPTNVTLFGESAGGMSVAALMASPRAQGLFAKAIPQSGAAHIGHDRDRATRVARALLDKMGIAASNPESLLDASYGAIVKAQIAILAESRDGKDPHKLGRMPFQPAIDGEVLPLKPIEAIAGGAARGVAMMTGTTAEEWKLFTAANPKLRLMSAKNFAERVQRIAGPELAPAMLAAYSEGSTFDRFNAAITDKSFMVPATRLLEAQGAHAPVFAYRFDWRSKLLGGIFGSCHALELGFVFGTHSQKLVNAFFGKGEAADALSSAMMDSWAAFARNGDPSATATGPWPRYDTATRKTMIFGDGVPHVVDAPNETRRKAWDNISERRLGP